MDFKIKISCHKCQCNFELRPETFSCKEIICPNCSAKVADEYATHIINGIRELSAVPESYPNNDGSFFKETGFSFKVQDYSLFDLKEQ